MEMYKKAPNKWGVIIKFTEDDIYQQVFDGIVGWEKNPGSGTRKLSGEELAVKKRLFDLHRDIKLRGQYPRMMLMGIERAGDQDAYVIEATPTAGKPEKLYFGVRTGLLLRNDFTFDMSSEKITVELYYGDYKQVNGMMLPCTLRQAGTSKSTMKFSEIEHNVTVDDAKFEMPANR